MELDVTQSPVIESVDDLASLMLGEDWLLAEATNDETVINHSNEYDPNTGASWLDILHNGGIFESVAVDDHGQGWIFQMDHPEPVVDAHQIWQELEDSAMIQAPVNDASELVAAHHESINDNIDRMF